MNGTILFDSRNIRLDGLTARVADGQVSFDGRIGLEGYAPADLSLTATGRNMRLRYPEGVRSEVDADLSLTGRVTAPVLSGMVTVQNAVWTTRFDTGGNLFDFGGGAGGGTPIVGAAPASSNMPPVRLDVRVIAPGTLRIENNDAQHRVERGPDVPRHLRAPDCLRQRGDLARRVHLRGPPLRRHARHGSTSRTRCASSRRSTSPPRRRCACPGRPIASC